ncbi:putative sulfate exporter family transporter [Labrys okinawensis]|uniref:Putative sulfate exporter family transporter n=1 Tax=Labrys okinawensis TaxID=346911 RepID=A0A2S9QHJ3_9HYPH|nr:YeiH family protein [Labrys okinawensis]PRH88814.1 putative sulfate exporter family transporter [Labrys okinawensis]
MSSKVSSWLGDRTGIRGILPGAGLCIIVTALAMAAELIETSLFGKAWLEALVLAILIGALIRTFAQPAPRFDRGITFGAKTLLEVAVVLLGASVSAAAIADAGFGLMAGIAGVVMVSIMLSFGIGRAFGLPHNMALLVACGNSICGNSAIAATAPVIGANGKDVAASIAFTAVLGVVAVIGLPLLVPALGLTAGQYGVFAGLTVYAVPQVLAATAPVAALSVQIGTLVKLARVLMLGPVIVVLALLSDIRRKADASAAGAPAQARPRLSQIVPWFIIGFLVMMALRSFGLLPQASLQPIASAANTLTIISMAALGLTVDIRAVAKAGPRVTSTVILSLLALGVVSYALIVLLKVA